MLLRAQQLDVERSTPHIQTCIRDIVVCCSSIYCDQAKMVISILKSINPLLSHFCHRNQGRQSEPVLLLPMRDEMRGVQAFPTSHLNSVSRANLSWGEWPRTQLLPEMGIISKGDLYADGTARVNIKEKNIGKKKKDKWVERRWHNIKLAWEREQNLVKWAIGRWQGDLFIQNLVPISVKSVSLWLNTKLELFLWVQCCTDLNLLLLINQIANAFISSSHV